MSLIVGSRSSGSSGPRPKTSSMTSPRIASRSVMLSGMPSSAIRSNSSVRISASARGALGRGQRLEVEAVEQLAVDVRLQLEILRPRRLGGARPARRRRAGRR